MTRRLLVVAVFLGFAVTGASGQSWDETTDGGGDADSLVNSAQGINVNGALTSITGSIAFDNDVDMYRIIITTGSAFSASTVSGASFDTILALVDENGEAVYLNDDDAACFGCLQSRLPAGDANSPSTDGDVYYIIIHGYDNHPQNASGLNIFEYDGLSGYDLVHGPSSNPGPVAQYQDDAGLETGAYTITLTSAEGDPTLPVELASFNAVLAGTDVLLGWETFSEQNNQGFDIEVMGPSDLSFRSIGFVEGHGTTTEAQSYSFRASGLDFGQHTFRLKQVDQDGSYAYSSNIEISVELPTAFVMDSVYPNPFNPQASFEFAVQDQQAVRASLYNMIGQEVAQLFNGVVEANNLQQVNIDGANLPSGIYIVRLAGEKFEATQTISLLK